MYHEAQHTFAKHGLFTGELGFDLPSVHGQKDAALRSLAGGIDFLFDKYGVTRFHASAEVATPGTVNLVPVSGGTVTEPGTISTSKTLLATGSKVRAAPFAQIDEKVVLSSTGALNLERVPEHLVVIGGGVIGLELGSVWSRLGAKVTVVEYAGRIAPGSEEEHARILQRQLGKQGMKFMLNSAVQDVSVDGDGVATVTIGNAKKPEAKPKMLKADAVLVAIGREPWTPGVTLPGLAKDRWGYVTVDDDYQTSVPGVYAIGDCVPGPMLAHKAEEEGVVCVERLAGHDATLNYATIPGIIYTDPELASVGVTEADASAAGYETKVGSFAFAGNSRAKATGVAGGAGAVKVVADAQNGAILGVHMVGPQASEMIHQGAIAMNAGCTVKEVADMTFGHPTLSEAVKEAFLAADHLPVHA
jgi:dihydrolipoamide dehydrogenase